MKIDIINILLILTISIPFFALILNVSLIFYGYNIGLDMENTNMVEIINIWITNCQTNYTIWFNSLSQETIQFCLIDFFVFLTIGLIFTIVIIIGYYRDSIKNIKSKQELLQYRLNTTKNTLKKYNSNNLNFEITCLKNQIKSQYTTIKQLKTSLQIKDQNLVNKFKDVINIAVKILKKSNNSQLKFYLQLENIQLTKKIEKIGKYCYNCGAIINND